MNDASAIPRPTRVRRWVWALFAGTLILALVVPVADLWQTWQTPVVMQVTLDPAQPRLGQPVALIVTLRHQSADLAQAAPLSVALDMLSMTMGMPPMQVLANGDHYRAALPLTMAGVWRVALHLAMPAHAPWQTNILVQVTGNAVSIISPGGGSV